MYLAICNGDGHYKRTIPIDNSNRENVEFCVGEDIDEIVLLDMDCMHDFNEQPVVDTWMTKHWYERNLR